MAAWCAVGVTSDCFPAAIDATLPFSKISLAPNPAHGNTTLQMDLRNSTDLHISIIDAMGHYVQTNNFTKVKAGAFSAELNLNRLAAGVYFVEVKGEGRGKMVKVVVW
jgi:Secretion system C-terminal sorting domain